MNSHHFFTAEPRALPALLDGADIVRSSRRAPYHSAMMLFAMMLMLTPLESFAQYWTETTSDGRPPIKCDVGDLISGVRCEGRFCDNLSLFCADTNFVPVSSSWQPFISEESGGNGNEWTCPSGFITGLTCTGDYCDNISVECTTMLDVNPSTSCSWLGYVSEEPPGELVFNDEYAVGVSCKGRFCDELQPYTCRVQ